jgi:uncharacterized protein YciI
MKKVLSFTFLVWFVAMSAGMVRAQSLYLVELISKADKPALSQEMVNQIQKEHMAHIRQLNNQGVLLAAGPFEGGGGLFVLQSYSADEAGRAVASDPAVKASRFDYKITPYTPAKGYICQVHENAEMMSMVFVRITPAAGRKDDFQIQKSHREFMARNTESIQLVYEGWDTSQADGFLVIKGKDVAEIESVFSKHPMNISGSLNITVKGLWIADGAFCD